MRKIIIYTALAMATAAFTLTSCEDAFGDFLDKQPSNELTEKEVFSQWSTTESFHFDTYNFLRHGAKRIKDSWLDAATDLAVTSYATGGVRTSFNIGNYYAESGASELTDTWEHYFRGIRKCNMTLERIDNVPKDPDLSVEQYERRKSAYKAEARFFRAYFHWELFLRYGAIPMIKVVLDPDGDLLSNYKTRPSVKEYTGWLLQELAECESSLYTVDEVEKNILGRVWQPTARALAARIKLYMASDRFRGESGVTWEDALQAADGFIADYGSNFRLYTAADGKTAYQNAILYSAAETGDGNNPEVIFWRNDEKMGWNDISADTPVGEGGKGGLCPSQNLIDMYDMADGTSPFAAYDATGAPVYPDNAGSTPAVRSGSSYNDNQPYLNRDPRMAASVLYHGCAWGAGSINVIKGQRDNPVGNANATPTGYYVRKYIPESILANVHSGTAYRNWIILRYAEILLNRAEALNECDGSRTEVLNALQPLRDRAGMTAKLVDRTDLQTKEERRNFIRKERTVELAFEEHRAWDVRRWNVAVEALARPIYGVEVSLQNNEVTYKRKVASQRVFAPKMYLYPIPEGEVWKTNIENNPEW